jgi:hypothetical protein
MALQNTAFDERNNAIAGPIDVITGSVFTDARTIAASLGALNAETIMQLNGQGTAVFDVRTATGNMTFVFEATVDGTNWYVVPAVAQTSQVIVSAVAITTTHAVPYLVPCAGYRAVRCRVSAFTSGTITVAARGTVAAIPPSYEAPYPTMLWVTATAAANAAATATLPAAGAGLFHYITHIDITRNATAALVGTGTLIHTTTNLPGNPAWSVGNAMVIGGTEKDVFIDFAQPLKSSVANTATTVVAAAAGLAVLGRVNVGYFVGM